ncbi:MAG TPA: gamma-glutamyl-gamma-aminobutyrate hydrolase family protein [Candidatus Saccharimonadales bacterium]|nr:gamma-glutamyl-gamma-aminobutyrate hydrolase family protein [Candidatus Saccharimonadales bacterium]
MKRRPLILVSPSTERKGAEFADSSISLSNRYTDAIIAGGGMPQIFPATSSRSFIAEAVERCDGVLLTGGDDIDPKLYAPNLPADLAKTVGPLEPERDVWEKQIIAEALRQRQPLFGICRGHQMLNVALGGTLVVDIPTQLPGSLNHRQMDRKMEPVHAITVEPDSLLGHLSGQRTFGVNSTHHQAVGRLAEGLRVVAQSTDGIIEAMEWKEAGDGPFLLTVQFHPERLIDSNTVFLQLFNGFVEACARWREKKL